MNTNRKTKIFVVDDDQNFLNLLVNQITTTTHDTEIIALQSGTACLESIDIHSPEIVVIDYNLQDVADSGINGLTTMRIVKRRFPNVKIILIAEEKDAKVAAKALYNGAFNCVLKNEHLLLRLSEVVNKAIEETKKLIA